MNLSSEILFTLGDLKRIFFSHKGAFKRAALFSALLVFLYLSFKEPRFQATATFRQSQGSDENVGKLRNLLNVVMLSEQDRGAASLMFSQRLGRMVVEKLGMQAKVGGSNFLVRNISNFWRNLSTEIGFSQGETQNFVFRDLFYDGEKGLTLFLRFHGQGGFELLDAKKLPLGKGAIGQPFRHGKISFTLHQAPENLSQKKLYPLSIAPWIPTVRHHLSRFQVKPHKQDKNLLRLFYAHPDRHIAPLFINEMMSAYQSYLKQENEELSDAQLAYLERRQSELSDKLDRVLQDQAVYLKENLGESGFIGLKEEVEMLAVPKEAYTTRLFDLEMEERRLEKRRDLAANEEREISSKKAQLAKSAPHQNIEKKFQRRLADLKLEEGVVTVPIVHREQKRVPEEIAETEGITLTTAQTLYASYQKELDEIQSTMRQLIYFRDQIHAPAFEISSLGGVLHDAVGQAMVQKAAEISLQLRDEKNHSTKEIVRLKEALGTEKAFLAHHMEQTVELEKVRARLVEEKLLSLQTICLDLIKKEKSLIQEKLKELTAKMEGLPEKWKRESHLQFTKELSMGIIEGISKVVESKNLTHNLFHVDSKPIDLATAPLVPVPSFLLLFSVGGGVLGASLLFLVYLAQGLVSGFPLSFESLKFYGLQSPGSFSDYCHAPLKEINASDLQTLRGIQQWILSQEKKGMCVVLVGGKLPDYSSNLAELFALQEKRVVLIQAAFDKTVSAHETSGLWPYLEGNITQIVPERKRGFDFIPAGGTSRHAPELLGRASFVTLLEKFKQEYDLVLIYSTARPAFVDAHIFFKYADAIVVSSLDEKAADLLPYKKWSDERENREFSVVCMEMT